MDSFRKKKCDTMYRKLEGIDFKEIEEGAYSGKELPEEIKEQLKEQGRYQDERLPTKRGDIHYEKVSIVIQAWNLKEEFDDLIKEKTHELDCPCSSCAFYTYKFFNPGSTISKENFFFGVVLIITANVKKIEGKRRRYDWTLAQRIMDEITHDDRYDDGNLEEPARRKKRMTRYKTGLRSVKIVRKAYLQKICRFDELVYYFYVRPYSLGKMLAIKKIVSEEKERVEKIRRLANERKQISLRDIEHEIHMKISDFHAIVMHYDGDIGLILDRGKRKDQLIFKPNPDAKVLHPFDRMLAEIKDGMIPVNPSTVM